MKLRLFATAAIAAAAISAPAFAQSVGSVGLGAAHTEIDAGGFEADGQTYSIDGNVAFKASPNWTITLNGLAGTTDGDLGDDSAFAAGAAATFAGADWRVGPTVSYSDAGDSSLWTVGGVAQKYLGDVTLSGAVNYGNIDDVDADIWTVGGEVRYFVSDNFRLNGGLTWATVDAGGVDADGWALGLGGEYQFASTPWSITGGYTHAVVDDADLDSDTFAIGVRYSFGGDLKARDRSGADLATGANPFASIF
ncbi:MAG: hypothetical protein V4466_15485 [Pseudomonadota bacterium]